jgi:hypothetical protein
MACIDLKFYDCMVMRFNIVALLFMMLKHSS